MAPPIADGAMFGVVASTSIQAGLTVAERSRLFALAAMSFHDALQTTFTSQYYYGRWRPVTAIRRADEDDNPATDPDLAWDSLLGDAATPPHPSYASNASSASASISKTLELFYGTDSFDFVADFGPFGTKAFSTFSSFTDDAEIGRIAGGAHFRYETDAGQQAGRDVATFIHNNYLTPARRPGSDRKE